jgi:hypothetical protein
MTSRRRWIRNSAGIPQIRLISDAHSADTRDAWEALTENTRMSGVRIERVKEMEYNMYRFAHGRRKSWNERGPDVGQVQSSNGRRAGRKVHVTTETDGYKRYKNPATWITMPDPSVVTIALKMKPHGMTSNRDQHSTGCVRRRGTRLVPVPPT